MKTIKGKAGTAATVPGLKLVRFHNRAIPQYLVSGIGSTELAARIIGIRFRLSPTIAGTVAQLAGYGRRA